MSQGLCSDCGTTRVSYWSGRYCRPCAEKGGHLYLFRKTVDVDKILEHFGGPGNEAAVESFLEEVALK